MPSSSERQRRAAGVALAVKRGKAKAKTKGVKRLAQIPEESLKHYARSVKSK